MIFKIMELYKLFLLLGFILITIGIGLYFVDNHKRISMGGVIFLGPVPIPFGNIPLTIVIILWLLYLFFVFLTLNHKTF